MVNHLRRGREDRQIRARAAAVGALTLMLAACGILQPTPARFRPPLPDPEAMPGHEAEDVIDELERRGFECAFEAPSDIPGGWSCRRGEQEEANDAGIGISSGEEGPVEDANAGVRIMVGPDRGPEPAVLDQAALATFYPLVEVIVPEEIRPSEEELLAGIQRNYPIELGNGWFIGFDRSSVSRNIRIVYSSLGD